MSHITASNATKRNIVPTIQCRVQKHAPAARKINVAAIGHCNPAQYCMRYWTEVVL